MRRTPPVPQQLTGWAYDPLNPKAPLLTEVYVNGKQGGESTADQPRADVNARGQSGDHGFTWTVPTAYRTGDPTWQVYALDQAADTTDNPAVRTLLPELKAATEWTVSGEGLGCLKNYEGVSDKDGIIRPVLYPYDDQDDTWPRQRVTVFKKGTTTIGYGHLINSEREWNARWKKFEDGTTLMTEEEADKLLKEDLQKHMENVQEHVKVPISQAEFNALTLLSFNIGEGKPTNHDKGFAGSSVARFLDGKASTAPDTAYASLEAAWRAWNKDTVDGKKVILPGLERRRRGESPLFFRGHYECTL